MSSDIIWDPESMFYYDSMGFDREKMPKNFERIKEKAYHQFYMDVYDFVLGLERLCKSIRKAKKEANRMLALENVKYHDGMTGYEKRRNQIKKFMCPLNDTCPDRIYERWPNSNLKTTTVIGSRCPYAHHTYELKFK